MSFFILVHHLVATGTLNTKRLRIDGNYEQEKKDRETHFNDASVANAHLR